MIILNKLFNFRIVLDLQKIYKDSTVIKITIDILLLTKAHTFFRFL